MRMLGWFRSEILSSLRSELRHHGALSSSIFPIFNAREQQALFSRLRGVLEADVVSPSTALVQAGTGTTLRHPVLLAITGRETCITAVTGGAAFLHRPFPFTGPTNHHLVLRTDVFPLLCLGYVPRELSLSLLHPKIPSAGPLRTPVSSYQV